MYLPLDTVKLAVQKRLAVFSDLVILLKLVMQIVDLLILLKMILIRHIFNFFLGNSSRLRLLLRSVNLDARGLAENVCHSVVDVFELVCSVGRFARPGSVVLRKSRVKSDQSLDVRRIESSRTCGIVLCKLVEEDD